MPKCVEINICSFELLNQSASSNVFRPVDNQKPTILKSDSLFATIVLYLCLVQTSGFLQ